MAIISWIGNADDLINAYDLIYADGLRKGIARHPNPGWAIIIRTGDTSGYTIASTPITSANMAQLNAANDVWFTDAVAGEVLAYSARVNNDTYIITTDFSEAAATGTDTIITITDVGVNTFRFRQGVQISSATLNDDDDLAISFGDSTHEAFIIQNPNKVKFKIGTTSNVELTLGEFLKLTENASTTAPYVVPNDFGQTDVPANPVDPGLSDGTSVEHLSTVVIHGVKFTLLKPDAGGTNGIKVNFETRTNNIVSLTADGNYYEYLLNKDATITPALLKEIWDDSMVQGEANDPRVRTAIIDAHIVDASLPAREAVALAHAAIGRGDFPDPVTYAVSNDRSKIYGTLKITDTDGFSINNSFPQYGTWASPMRNARREIETYDWSYTFNPQDPDIADLDAGTHMEEITVTITDGTLAKNKTVHTIAIGFTKAGSPPADSTFINPAPPTLVIHGVKFTYASDVPLLDGAGIAFGVASFARISRPGGVNGPVYNIRQGRNAPKKETTPDGLVAWWKEDNSREEWATATVIDNMLGALRFGDYVRDNFDRNDNLGDLALPVLFTGSDRAVSFTHGDPTNDDLEAGGGLIITDTDGVRRVDVSGETYGTFEITQEVNDQGMKTNNWNWTYTLNLRDHDTRILKGAGQDTITLTVTDGADSANETPYQINIRISAFGTAPDPNTTFLYDAPGADTTVEYDYTEGATNDNLTASGTLNITDANGIESVLESADAPAKYGNVAITHDGDDYTWTYTLNPEARATRALSDLATDMHTETITLIITDMDDPATTTMREITVGVMITGTAPAAETNVADSSDEDTKVTLDLYPQIQPGGTAAHEPMAGGTLTLTNIDGVDTVVQSTGAPAKYGTFAITREAGSDDWEWTYTLDPDDVDTAALTEAETETIALTITDLRGNTDTHAFDITIGIIDNEPPTATPVAQTIDEDETLPFALADVRFTDPNMGDGLASITIVSLPDKGVLTLDGVPVAEGDEIMAGDIEDRKLVYTPPDDLASNDDTSFQITVQDMGGLTSEAAAEWTININAMDSPPDLAATSTIAIEVGDGPLVLTRNQIPFRDPDGGPEVDTSVAMLTLIEITGGMLELYSTTSNMWEELAVNGTFTKAQVNDGHVRLTSTAGGSFTISGVLNSNALTEQVVTFTGRATEDLMYTKVGLPEVDLGTETESKRITTGIGKTKIRPGSGDDRVDGGLGDDEIDLTAGGRDTVIYRFETRGVHTIAWSGGDIITGFTPGEDRLLLDEIGGNGRGDFLDGLERGFVVSLVTAYTGGSDGSGDRKMLASYTVEGIEIHFSQAVLLPGGALSGAVLTIHFAEPIPWDEFNTEWLGASNQGSGASNEAGAFDEDTLLFRANDAGKAALKALLGLGMVTLPPLNGENAMDQPEGVRSVALGDDNANNIDLSEQKGGSGGQGGDWVVFGGGGDDTITLGSGTPPAGGTEDVIYRLAIDASGAITDPDGIDVISGFDLGMDMLTFVDTAGATATLANVLSAFQSVSLDSDDKGNTDASDDTYTGITFNIDGTSEADATGRLEITFATAKAKADLAATPTTPSDPGIAFIDELFGAGNISVEGSLPTELL